MENKKEMDKAKVEKIKKDIQKTQQEELIEQVLKDNKVEFEYEDVKYKVEKPTFEQREEVNKKRIAKYIELLQAKNDKEVFLYKSEEDLIELYKERGIDINDMDKQMNNLNKKKESFMLKLGKAIKEKRPDNELRALKEQIADLTVQQQEISIRKTYLLETSIENQILVYVYSYLTCLATQKLVNKKWVPAWKDYSEFMNDDEDLVNLAVAYGSLILKSEIRF